jgi:hypothetical protein
MTLANVTVTSGNVTITNVTVATANVTTSQTLNYGTANGVVYLNTSKVATSGTGLVFDGTNLGVGGSSSVSGIEVSRATGVSPTPVELRLTTTTNDSGWSTSNPWGRLSFYSADASTGGAKIHASIQTVAQSSSGGNSNLDFFVTDTANGNLYRTLSFQGAGTNTTQTVFYSGGGATAMTLDASGNFGLGTTPSLNAGQRGLFVSGFSGGYSALSLGASSSGYGAIGYNIGFTSTDGTYKAITSDNMSWIRFQNGQFQFFQQTSVTGGTNYTGTQAMTLDANGNFVLGTTAPLFSTYRITSWGGRVNFAGNNDGLNLYLQYSSGTAGAFIGSPAADVLAFSNSAGAERARITSAGYSKFSDNGTYANATDTFHEFYQSANNHALYIRANSTSQTADPLQVAVNRNTTNNTFYAINYYNVAAGAYKFRVADSGTVTNTTGVYGTIPSERRFKQDIVDAPSQWDDIKNIRLRKYRMKSDVEQNGDDALTQLGIIIDELEPICPGLIDEHPVYEDRDVEDENGNVTKEKVLVDTVKGWKTSIVHLKALKALQEAMDRIEKLEAEVALLKGAK